MIKVATGVRPTRLVLWFVAVAIAQAAVTLPFAGLGGDGGRIGLFTLYVSGSSVLAVWGLSSVPEIVANAETKRGRNILQALAGVAMLVALVISAHFAERFNYHPFSLIFVACVIVLASLPFFVALVLTLVTEWYVRLPKKPRAPRR